MSQIPSDHPDQHFIEGILSGDNAKIHQIYKQFTNSATAYIYKNGGSQDDARDIFQEAVMLIYRKAKAEELTLTGSFGGYLASICKFLWMNQRKKKYRSEVTIQEDMTFMEEAKIEDVMMDRMKDTLFRKKFRELNPDCQRLLTMFFEGTSMKEIAEKMGYSSEQYAKKRKFQCKTRLVNLIENDQLFQELVRV